MTNSRPHDAIPYESSGVGDESRGPARRATIIRVHPISLQQTREVDPLARETKWKYDQRGNCEEIVWPTGGTVQTSTEQTTCRGEWRIPWPNWSWEVEKSSIHARDAVGHLTTFRRDGGLITAIETPGRATAFSYDEHGNQTRAVDSLAGETVYTHDNLGRITTATDARGGVTRFVHDPVGKTIGVQRANGGSIKSAYDPEGCLTSVSTETTTVHYRYGHYRRVVARSEASSLVRFMTQKVEWSVLRTKPAAVHPGIRR